ncbi:MAG: hypothetical protein JXR46_05955 [Calditrichaceae bacterium]|nr:hypothetical protein [Calditrichaceae bacterium]MBN2708569.1 hypothetical protein [Calditrichaceae bacterium]RQV96878.1 MAG: hypothetical protein EH224_03220 [Calditrichota bacterium]
MLKFSDKDLKEIFALFSSSTIYELKQIYNKNDNLYFENENLNDEYELVSVKREFALDALRSVLYWLNKKGYSLYKNSNNDKLDWVKTNLFINV